MTSMAKIKGERLMVSGTEALLRFAVLQRQLDQAAGHATSGFISGYRGSPLAGFDRFLWRREETLKANDITFQPALNEDLAATAVWGAQIARAFGPVRTEGVFGLWYGKGPGVDRTGDVFRHANMQGTTSLGGVVAIAGDDHAAQSSVLPHQSDGIFQSTFIPVFQPADVADIISMGLSALALSRYSGLWTAMKTVTEVVESAMVLDEASVVPSTTIPDFEQPPHGLNWDPGLSLLEGRFEVERRLIEERLPAAQAWIAANPVNRVIYPATEPRICVVTTGKAHQDVMQALADLGIGPAEAERLGLGVFKYGVSWPLSTTVLHRFFGSCPEFLVVEEKQPIVETQLKAALFNESAYRSSRIVGKYDETGARLLKETTELTPFEVAEVLLGRLSRLETGATGGGAGGGAGDCADIIAGARARLELIKAKIAQATPDIPLRKPFFCAGCPHNSSLNVPDGAIASGGIGCHAMAVSQDKFNTDVLCHMGGEGGQWIGAQVFSERPHIFQNLGDGTYQHSGILAIRAAVAADTPVTFKILYNDAVAMTGGQAAEGNIDPARVTRQLHAEGVARIALVSDEAAKWRGAPDIAPGTLIEGREALGRIQRDFARHDGVSAIVYEQTCAAEKRRRRKKNLMPDPDRRIFINDRVCEGCGDCSVQSNCIAIEPVKTPFGEKRRVNQSSCNKDMTCVTGFCPSFIEVSGGTPRKPEAGTIADIEADAFSKLAEPPPMLFDDHHDVFIAGIGGTGILTLGAVIGEAARIAGLSASILDFTGLAQKNGTVVSHVRLAPPGRAPEAVRIPDGGADLLIAADYLAAASPANIRKMSRDTTVAVMNTHDVPTAEHVKNRDFSVNPGAVLTTLRGAIADTSEGERDFSQWAEKIFGDTIAANMMMMGFAYQRGWLPLSAASIEQAITEKGIAVRNNSRAFNWGRVCADDPARLAQIKRTAGTQPEGNGAANETTFGRCARELKDYQNEAYADLYKALVTETREASARLGPAGQAYCDAVEKYTHKVMAYKDEYEVARLYCAPDYRARLEAAFSSWRSLHVWLAPPGLGFLKKDANGRPKKRKFGGWVLSLFQVLKRFRFLRGSVLDPFGHSSERRAERRLVREYFELVRYLNKRLATDTVSLATKIASLPDDIRGFGPVKLEALGRYEKSCTSLMAEFADLCDAAEDRKNEGRKKNDGEKPGSARIAR